MKEMKKLFNLTAILSAVLFVGCSTIDDELSEMNEETTTLGAPVKAQFTISIPMDNGTTTRMTSDVVQNAQTIASFRGIDFIKLFPSAIAKNAPFSSTSALGAPITLSQMLKPTQASVSQYIPSAQLTANNNSVLYGDVLLSTNTRTFLFYGKAIDNTANTAISTPADCFKFGILQRNSSLDAANPTDASSFSFSPVPITTADKSSTKRTAILNYINSIVNATDGTTAWKDCTNTGLANLYTKFTSMTAGSSANLQAAVEDLYNALKDNAHTVAVAICDAINPATDSPVTVSLNTTTNVATVTFGSTISGYPSSISDDNLPDGAAVLSFDTTNGYTYASSSASSTTLNVANIVNYAYPANLYYWVISELLTANTSQADKYISTMTWDDTSGTGIFNSYTDGDAITADTRSVLLKDKVQYGVGRLDIKVVGTNSTLSDNGANFGESAKSVALSDIKLTGVLIGGQKNVGWNFTPIAGTEYTIYDNICYSQPDTNGDPIPGVTVGSNVIEATSVMNHTLVLETAGPTTSGSTTTPECVNVALEFINNGADFWGKDGIVPTGTHFYLVGQLNVANVTSTESDKTGGKVFKQDYITNAHFTISNLTKAENTIPDLRNPAIELGLSVDLTWQEGITFSHTFN